MVSGMASLGGEWVRKAWARSVLALGFAASAVTVPADKILAGPHADASAVAQMLEHETPVSNRRLLRELHKKQMLPVSPAELKSDAQGTYGLLAAFDAIDKKWPVYVDTRQTQDDNPHITLHKTRQGAMYLVINEAAHRWTEAYVRSQYPDWRDMRHLEHVRAAVPISHLPGGKEIENDFRRLANGMGLTPVPLLYVKTDDVPGFKNAEAGRLKDGTRIIFMTQSARRHWTRIQTEGMLCHELGHEIHNDVLPAGLVAAHNDYAVSRKMEAAADANVGNPACLHPEGALQVLQNAMQDERNMFFAGNKQASEADFIQYDHDNGTTHPPYLERIRAVEKWVRPISTDKGRGI